MSAEGSVRPVWRLWDLSLSLEQLLAGLIGLCTAAILVGFLLLGPSPLFDRSSAVLTVLLAVLCIGTMRLTEKRQDLFPTIALLNVFFILYVFPRLLSYLYVADVIELKFGAVDHTAVNNGLLYILLGSAVLVAGFWCAASCQRRVSEGEDREWPSHPIAVLFVFMGVILVEWAVNRWSGITPYGKLQAEDYNWLFQMAKVVFDVEMMYFVILAAFLCQRVRTRSWHWVMATSSVAIMVFTALNGSRLGGLRIMLMLLAVLLWQHGNVRLRATQWLVSLVVLGSATVALYPIASQVRIDIAAEHWSSRGSEYSAVPGEIHQTGLGLYSDLPVFAATISDHLGILDFEILVLSLPGQEESKAKYLTLSYAGKNIINFVVPGVVFPDAVLDTSRVMTVIYRGFTEEYVRGHGYFSEVWTAWGLAGAMFGWWGGLLALFIAGSSIQLGVYCVRGVPERYGVYAGSFYMYVVPMTIYATMGMDHTTNTIIVSSVQMCSSMFFFLTVPRLVMVVRKLRSAFS